MRAVFREITGLAFVRFIVLAHFEARGPEPGGELGGYAGLVGVEAVGEADRVREQHEDLLAVERVALRLQFCFSQSVLGHKGWVQIMMGQTPFLSFGSGTGRKRARSFGGNVRI